MNQNKVNFESEDLKLDYISFNLQFSDMNRIEEMANYLSDTFHCKSFLFDKKTEDKSILKHPKKCYYSATFEINSNKHWSGTILFFSFFFVYSLNYQKQLKY